MSDRQLLSYGLTTQATAVGLSTLSFIDSPRYVIKRSIHATGGTLFISGVSSLVGMAIIPGGQLEIEGPAPFWLLSGGATATAHIITFLSNGFSTTTGY